MKNILKYLGHIMITMGFILISQAIFKSLNITTFIFIYGFGWIGKILYDLLIVFIDND